MTYKALIVDDEPDEAADFGGILKDYGQFVDPEIFENTAPAWERLRGSLREFDVVFIDIIGTAADGFDSADLLATIQGATREAMPVVMLTGSDFIPDAQKHWDATDYWMKDDLPLVDASEDTIDAWQQKWLEPLIRKLEAYQLHKRLLFDPIPQAGMVRKESLPNDTELKQQANFLLDLHKRRDVSRLKDSFPVVTNSRVDMSFDTIFYEMPYYPAHSLSTVFLQDYHDTNVAAQIAERTLSSLLDLLFTELYISSTKPPSLSHVAGESPPHFTKYFERRTELLKSVVEIPDIGKRSDFTALLSARKLQVGNDPAMDNLHLVLHELRESRDFMLRIHAPAPRLIHGDIHFDNILVYLPFPNWPRIMLIDPKGYEPCDIAIDCGKMLMSTHGDYDLIRRRLLKLDGGQVGLSEVDESGIPDICYCGQWRLSPHERMQEGSGASPARTTRTFYSINDDKWHAYRRLHIFVLRTIAKHFQNSTDEELRRDHDWPFRSLFAEVLHLANVAANHARKGISRLVAARPSRGIEQLSSTIVQERECGLESLDCACSCYIRAVQLMHELRQFYGSDLRQNCGKHPAL